MPLTLLGKAHLRMDSFLATWYSKTRESKVVLPVETPTNIASFLDQ